ncbi:MAG: hypothetical protein ACJAS3_000906 [Roseivirga sp.]|jgi:hypothetical protein
MMVYGQLVMMESRNAFILISLLLLCTYTVYKVAFPKVFKDLVSLNKIFGFKVKADLGSNLRPFSSEHLYFTALNSFSASFVALFMANSLDLKSQLPSFLVVDHYAIAIIQWIALGVALNLMIYMKFLLILFFGMLFDIKQVISRHFVDMVNASLFFFILMIIFLTFTSFSSVIPNPKLVEIAVVFTLIFYYYRSLLLFIRLLREHAHTRLYIFSYICATELTPLTFGLVLLINSQV